MFKKLLPTLLAAGGAALVAVTPAIQGGLASFASKHTTAAAAITAIFSIFAHLWPSPLGSK